MSFLFPVTHSLFSVSSKVSYVSLIILRGHRNTGFPAVGSSCCHLGAQTAAHGP